MRRNIIEKINIILEGTKEKDLLVQQLIEIIEKEKNGIPSDLYSNLSDRSLKRIYSIIDKLDFDNHMKEHILWLYYKKSIEESKHIRDDDLEKFLKDYKKHDYAFLSLESVISHAIKMEKLDVEQVKLIQSNIPEKVVLKEAIIYILDKDIKKGQKLNKENVKELIDFRAFDFLISSLERNMIKSEALHLFNKPEPGEKDKRKKDILYTLKQKYEVSRPL